MLNIVPEAILPPAVCAVTRSATGPFVDTGRSIPRFGRIYLSVPYLRSLADGLGLVPAPELEQALTDLDEAYSTIERLSTRVEGFEEDVQNVADAMANFTAEMLVLTDVDE